MPCLFFYARSRETFGPRRHIDLTFYPGQPYPRLSYCNTFDSSRRIADCFYFAAILPLLHREAYLFPASGHGRVRI